MSTLITGIDVSRWQGTINWGLVARNVKFAMIKIGGSDDGFYADGQAVRNVLEARANKIPVGFYVFLGGVGSVQDEVNHIKNLVNNIGGLRQGEPLCLDWEVDHSGDQVRYLADIIQALLEAGFPSPIIYMSLSRVKEADWSPVVKLNCALWVAAWGNNDATPDQAPPSDEWKFWALWQYSSTGSVPGISGRVDMDIFAGTVEQFQKYGSTRAGGVRLPAPVNNSKVVLPAGLEEYAVKKDENLSMIAARFGKSWQQLWSINRDRVSNPDRIFPGLKLRVWASKKVPVALPTPTHVSKIHVVEKDESLSVIAARYRLPSWVYLWEANKDIVPDPDFLRPGQKLRIP